MIQMMTRMIQMLMMRKYFLPRSIKIKRSLNWNKMQFKYLLNSIFCLFIGLSVMKLRKMMNRILIWKICRYKDHYLKIQMMPHLEKLNRVELENCKYLHKNLHYRNDMNFQKFTFATWTRTRIWHNIFFLSVFRFKYITNRVSTVSQTIVASAEHELNPALRKRSTPVTHYHSTPDDTKN